MSDNKPGANSRRNFLKMLGLASASTLIPLSGCGVKQSIVSNTNAGPVPDDKMTYRNNPRNGDKISLLGYGCMRKSVFCTTPQRDSCRRPRTAQNHCYLNDSKAFSGYHFYCGMLKFFAEASSGAI